MKIPALLLAGTILAVALAQQVTLPEPLATDLSKLSSAKALRVSFSLLLNGDPQGKYQLEMSKDNLFRLTTPKGFVLSDGKSVYSYTKSSNSYTVSDVNDDELKKFDRKPEIFGWAAFLEKKPGTDIESATPGGTHPMKGGQVQDVAIVLKEGKGTGTVFVDTQIGIARGFKLKEADKEYLAIADTIETPSNATAPEKFAFVAPDGAKKVEITDAGPTFGQVQQLMTDNCMPCHDSSHRKAGFDLTSYDGIAAAVTAGDSDNSMLVKALRGTGGADPMPRGRSPLSEDQIQTVEKWIKNGAKRD
jgi:outer membrane lipoprotein-sorting protein